MIDPSKPVKTVTGRTVRILCSDRVAGKHTIVGLIHYGEVERVCAWTAEGKLYDGGESDDDLVNA